MSGIPELKPTTWQAVYQAFRSDVRVSRKELEWVRVKLQRYCASAFVACPCQLPDCPECAKRHHEGGKA